MSSNSESSTQRNGGYCFCGRRAPRRTTWTRDNMGRRFLGCSNYPNVNCCQFFEWVDKETCSSRGKELLAQVKQKIDAKEDENRELRSREAGMFVELKNTKEQNMVLEGMNLKNKEEIDLLRNELKGFRERNCLFLKFLGYVVVGFLIVLLALLSFSGDKNSRGMLRLP